MDCCEPLCCVPLTHDDADRMARILKSLSDPTRLRLFSMIASGGEQCACDLTEPLGVGQPTVSHHLKVLTDAGLLVREQRGKWAWFRARPDALEALSTFLAPDAAVGVRVASRTEPMA